MLDCFRLFAEYTNKMTLQQQATYTIGHFGAAAHVTISSLSTFGGEKKTLSSMFFWTEIIFTYDSTDYL